nr:immunoglobulin light chain junction region [Macaca mulatta]MOW69335.1 immunoglobulin light chain junction region [Macaca mulatta]MOW69418.1 immunoglobulin light chain junction region [Macaca mulatta]
DYYCQTWTTGIVFF